MLRDTGTARWYQRAALHAFSGGLSGAAAGAALGKLGSILLPPGLMPGLLVAVTVLVLGAVGLQLAGRPPRRCQKQTPRRWLKGSGLVWSLRNGTHLGLGVATKKGFWLFFLVPVSAVVAAAPAQSALIYGSYGFVRTALPGLLVALLARQPSWDVQRWLLRQAPVASGLATVAGLAVALTLALSLGNVIAS